MRIVFVLGDAATMKDCDNMAKGLLDAFQGLLYDNDKQVEHLDLIKIHHHPGAGSGYILVRVASTTINSTDDVLVPSHAELRWMQDLDVEIARGPSTSGLVVSLAGRKPGTQTGRTILLRGDMDALPMPEETGLHFASKIPGRDTSEE